MLHDLFPGKCGDHTYGYEDCHRTRRLHAFRLSETVTVLDFPGSTDHEAAVRNALKEAGNVSSFFVVVMNMDVVGPSERELIKNVHETLDGYVCFDVACCHSHGHPVGKRTKLLVTWCA